MSGVLVGFPDSAPLVREKGIPETYKPVLLEGHLYPTLVENIASVLDIDLGFLPGTIVGALWNRKVFPAGSTWAVARMTVNVEPKSYTAWLLTPLAIALDWGAIGLRRPPAGRQPAEPQPDGSVAMSDSTQQDFGAFYEVCNVLSCGVLAREWRSRLDTPVAILLDEVVACTPATFPEGLDGKGLLTVQGTIGYSERKLPLNKDGTPNYEHEAPFALIIPALLGVEVLWSSDDGTERKKTEWLVKTGAWRWKGR